MSVEDRRVFFLKGKLAAIRAALIDAEATAIAHRKKATVKMIREAIFRLNHADILADDEIPNDTPAGGGTV
jgi:hypothetical protein